MTSTSGEPRLAAGASWAVLASSFGLSAATWIALADLAGFNRSLPLPGSAVRVHLSWLMPLAVDGYVVVALVLWMSPVPARVAAFARTNTYAAAGVGVVAQAAFHALSAWSTTGVAWRAGLAAIVGALPPGVAALAVHMRALLRRESRPESAAVRPGPEQLVPVTAEPILDEVGPDGAGVVLRPVPGLVPVPAGEFTRVNGATIHSGAVR